MKHFILSLATLFTAQMTFAQNFVYSPSQERFDYVVMENFEAYQIDITTTNPETITFGYELVSNTFPSAWSYSLCDQGNCYVGFPSSAQMNTITMSDAQNGMKGFLKINLTVGMNYGHGVVKFYVYDVNDYSRGDTVTFDVTWSATGLEENLSASKAVYPNPFKESFTIENSSNKQLSYQVADILGKEVATGQLAAGRTALINTFDLQDGIYFVILSDGDRKYTKKIMKR